MKIPGIIIFLGLLIFLSHLFNNIFNRTKIPNVLLLLLIGIIAGPVTGQITPEFMGEFGSVFTTITLIVIMFESGVNLKFSEIKKAIGSSLLITILNFIISAGIGAVLANVFTGLTWINAVFVGSIIGGTSSAVVIPMVKQLNLSNKNQTILFLESALSDVLCLVVGLAVLEGMRMGAINISDVFSKMWKGFLFSAILGVFGGFVWSALLKLVRGIKNSMFTSFAFVFILYGFVEMLELNGGIAALCFGIILGNSDIINRNKAFKKIFAFETTAPVEHEKNFYAEVVFILQTYFFVFVGISIQFGNFWTYLVGLGIVALTILSRPLSIKLFTSKNSSVGETAIMSVMTPKGLVPAVLASIPLQLGLQQGEKIQDLGYSVVLFSIVICSILVIMLSKDPLIIKKLMTKNNSQDVSVTEDTKTHEKLIETTEHTNNEEETPT